MSEKNFDDIIDGVANPAPEQDPGKEEPEQTDPPEPETDEPEKADPNDPEQETDPEPDPDKGDPEEDKPEKDEPKKADPKKQDNSVIRNLRQQQKESSKQLKEYDNMLDKIAKQQGITKDELVEKLQNEADEKEAKEKNIPPEVQKQLRTQQEALDNLKQERQRDVFNTKFDKLTEEYPMENEEARKFVQDAIEMGIDLGNPNTDFKAVYFALNHDTLIEQAREEERQKAMERIEKEKKKSPGLTKKRSQGDGVKKGNIDDAVGSILGQ